MRNLYWKIRYAYERWYFNRKYRNKGNKVFYDRKYRCYVCPKLIEERGDIEYVIAELTRTGLIYEYKINEEWSHGHFFADVLIQAYNEANNFEIPEEVKEQYSKQELNMVEKAIEHGKMGD